uniref:CAP-Gly domain-containing protein n=1 Tax=Hyaloperonospora arabidopsidis (strain Emoy2) TaxID=559515 RepID=M4B9N6_HYAAE
MPSSENVEAALSEVIRPLDIKVASQRNRLQMLSMNHVNEDVDINGFAVVGDPKRSLAYELVTMLRPKRSDVSSNGDGTLTYEYDDLPILESSRTSCCTPGKPVVLAMSRSIDRSDRLSDCLPRGELHVWVYEACRLLDSRAIGDMTLVKHGIRVRCDLLGAVQISPCNINQDMRNPVWRRADNRLRDGMGGHFAWAVNEPVGTSGDRLSGAAQLCECKLDIELMCGERLVGSASVLLEDLLLLPQIDALDGDGLDGNHEENFCLVPHWLPLAGSNAGLLQVSLEFVPASQHTRRDAIKCIDCTGKIISSLDFVADDDGDDANESFIEFADLVSERPQSTRTPYSRDPMNGRRDVPWLDKRHDSPVASVKKNENSRSKVTVSRSGGVTMYVPTQNETTPFESVKRPARNVKSSMSKSDSSSCGKGTQMMDKQLQDLYNFGIAKEPPVPTTAKDSKRFTRTTSMASVYSGKASTCASDAFAYNELIQDMESTMNSMRDTAPCTSKTRFIHAGDDNREQTQVKATENESMPTSKLKLKNRRRGEPTHNLSKPLDPVQSLRHDTRACDSSSNESNRSRPPQERSNVRKIEIRPSSNNDGPVTLLLRTRTPSPLQRKGVVQFDPQNQRVEVPIEYSTFHEDAHEMASRTKRERRAAGEPLGRLSLPISQFSFQQRRDMLAQQQPNRFHRQLFEDELGLQPFPFESVDPPLLRRGRSDSIYTLNDLYPPKTEVTSGATSAKRTPGSANSVTDPASQGETQGTAARRHSGSNVVYIDGEPSCIGKLINIGNVPGVVRFIGTTHFATGTWVGIELCEQMGKNSGTIDGQKYFSCAPNHGIFIRASRLGLSLKL